MLYKREISQVLLTVLHAGNGGILKIGIPPATDPLSGIPTGPMVEHESPFVVVTYSREDISNPSLANGLTKVLICPVTKDGVPIPDFIDIVENKNAVVTFPDGKEFKILHSNVVKPDGKTPIVARAFLGG